MALTGHVSNELLDRYAAQKATAAEILAVQTHITVCEKCREKLARMISPEIAFAAVRNDFAFDDFDDAPEHPAYEQLEFFADHKLDEVDREIAESHLAICGECAKDLTDLYKYREIAAISPVTSPIIETAKQSFWSKIFAVGTIGTFAPVVAILLIAVLFGAWFLLRNTQTGEIAKVTTNQNAALSNIGLVNNSPKANVTPESSPEAAPSPIEKPIANETLYALNDGGLTVDDKGNVKGAENLSPAVQSLIKQSLQTGKLTVTNHSLGGNGGVLMGENNADGGIPFGLETPVGKVIKENRPLLRWKSLKDAASYSAAIVDEKFRVVEQSGDLTATNWQPSKPLLRGANYSWQVTAKLKDGTETVSPSSPAPQARFRVIEQNLFNDINKLEKSGEKSHLALGILYAKAGLRREARAEFEKLVKENPKSDAARKLLQSIK